MRGAPAITTPTTPAKTVPSVVFYKAGFTFYFLSAVCAIAAGMNILGEVDQLANGGGEREIALTVEHKKEIASVFHTLSPEKQQEVINLAKEMKNSPTGATKQTGV